MKLFFAGVESKAVREAVVRAQIKNVLLSYYYIIRRSVPVDFYLENFSNIALDSGGFTMIAKARTKKDSDKSFAKEMETHEDYLERYLRFIHDNIGKFYWVANYDVGLLVGENKVLEWNKEFEKLEKKGQRVCYIAHDYSVPYENLYRYFDMYDMIGVASDHKGAKDNVGYFSQVYNLSVQKEKLVHGFAMTNFVSFRNFPFYSCDSTTYLGGARYGSTYVYNGSYFETWDFYQKHRRKFLKRQCAEWNIDFEGFVNDEHRAVTEFNVRSWVENEKLFNRVTRNKQWWTLQGVA